MDAGACSINNNTASINDDPLKIGVDYLVKRQDGKWRKYYFFT